MDLPLRKQSTSWATPTSSKARTSSLSEEAQGISHLLFHAVRNSPHDHRIGYGAAAALLDVGAKVTIISSNQTKLDAALKQLNSPNVKGVVSDVRDEEAYTRTLQSLAPVDHIVFSAVDNIIRGKLVDYSLDDAKHLFGVKFWGAVITGKGEGNCENFNVEDKFQDTHKRQLS